MSWIALRRLASQVNRKIGTGHHPATKTMDDYSCDELAGLMRHEAHRIEKAHYNGLLESKEHAFRSKRERLGELIDALRERGYPQDDPTVLWASRIFQAFDDMENEFVQAECGRPLEPHPDHAARFMDFLKSRRSARVWAQQQPSARELEALGLRMIDAARWAPSSGNRQALRFAMLTSSCDKALLTGIKEVHCVSAPLLIFVGADSRLYGALGPEERCPYIDAGAAIMQMLLLAHSCGFGTCWNHLADDLIQSRDTNSKAYIELACAIGAPDYLRPVAIVAVGVPEFTPPVPARMDIERFLLNHAFASRGDTQARP